MHFITMECIQSAFFLSAGSLKSKKSKRTEKLCFDWLQQVSRPIPYPLTCVSLLLNSIARVPVENQMDVEWAAFMFKEILQDSHDRRAYALTMFES